MEAVIVATARTPIGRANKGSLVDLRPDDLAADDRQRRCSSKVPELDPADGRGRDHGAARSPPASRATTSPASSRSSPGSTTCPAPRSTATARRRCRPSAWPRTRSRRARATCSSPAGVEMREPLRQRAVRRRPRHAQRPQFADARGAHEGAHATAASPSWTPPAGAARRLHRDGPDRRERRASTEGVTREEMDEFAALSQQRAVAVAGERASSSGRSRRSPLPTARSSAKDDGPRPGTTVEKLAGAEAGVPPRRHRHRRQRVPAQRRCGRGRRDERHPGRTSSASQPLARIVVERRVGAQPRDHGPRPDRARAARRWRAPG